MGRKYSIFITVLFCAALAIVGALIIVTPDKGFSETENRFLQEFPEFGLEELASGEFTSEFETYITDQFPGRDGWVSLKTWSERISGKKENNGVFFGTDGETLIEGFTETDTERFEKNLGYVTALTEKTDADVYFALIPGKSSVYKSVLPANAPVEDEWPIIEKSLTATGATAADLYTLLMSVADEYVYYRNDHHWTSLGAYYGYTQIMRSMGITPVPLSEYEETVQSEEFYGTTYSSSGVRWTSPDSISTYVPEDGIEVTSYFTDKPEAGVLYDYEYLEKKDKYSMFLGGNQPLCIVQTGSVDAPKLLIVRDSYADSMVPFLTPHFSEIHLIDPRYNMNSVSEYAAENDIDAILVMYGVTNFMTDNNLFVLGR